MYKPILLVAAFMLCYTAHSQTISQNLISSAQQTAIADNFNYSWSIGETLIQSDNSKLSTGYHSVNSITINAVNSNKEANSLSTVIFYPNPTKRFLRIDMSQLRKAEYILNIYDLKGVKITPSYSASENIKTIDLEGMETGMYYITIVEKDTEKTIKQIKIIKK